MKMTKRERAMLVLLLTVITVLVALFALILPLNMKTNAAKNNIETLKNDIEDASDAEMRYYLMEAHKVEAQKAFDEVSAAIPISLEDSQALRTLNNIISTHTTNATYSFGTDGAVRLDSAGVVTMLSIDVRFSVPMFENLMSILNELSAEKNSCTVLDLSYRQYGDGAVNVAMSVQFVSRSEIEFAVEADVDDNTETDMEKTPADSDTDVE